MSKQACGHTAYRQQVWIDSYYLYVVDDETDEMVAYIASSAGDGSTSRCSGSLPCSEFNDWINGDLSTWTEVEDGECD